MCPNCSGIGRYYTEEYAGVKVHHCSCEQSMTIRQAQELKFKSFLEQLNLGYVQRFGIQAPSFVAYQVDDIREETPDGST